MSFFLSLFRQFLPDLHTYFEEEAVDMRELASAWLEGLFAREMQIEMLRRLWGMSLSSHLPLALFACLATSTRPS